MSTTPLEPPPAPQAGAGRKPVTVHRLAQMRAAGEKIAMLTCYDACFARALDEAGVDMLLVGDSLGMVLQGRRDTLGVSVDDMVYHVRCVAAGARAAMVAADMPFGSYQAGAQQAFDNAVRLMGAGAQMVKLEGGAWLAPTVRFLVERGVPVCAHVGFTPQSLHQLGGYRVQGRDDASAQRLLADADALADAGAAIVLMEMVPAALAARVTERLAQPAAARPAVATIGIGAGRDCSGQVLVLHDLLGIASGVRPRFVRNFLAGHDSIDQAIRAYVAAVRDGSFPGPEHAF